MSEPVFYLWRCALCGEAYILTVDEAEKKTCCHGFMLKRFQRVYAHQPFKPEDPDWAL
jgi:hypothetical protein